MTFDDLSHRARLDAETLEQMEGLSFTGKPIVVVDVDEVALEFVIHLENHLINKGFRLIPRSYGLTGNILRLDNDEPAEQADVRDLLYSFFAEDTHLQTPVPGVAEALERLSRQADVLFLTNMPSPYRQTRIDTLKRHGMTYPVITNTGSKGPAVREIALRAGHDRLAFLDDSPNNVRSVKKYNPGTVLVHFIADKRFFAMAERMDDVDLMANEWPVAADFVASRLGGT